MSDTNDNEDPVVTSENASHASDLQDGHSGIGDSDSKQEVMSITVTSESSNEEYDVSDEDDVSLTSESLDDTGDITSDHPSEHIPKYLDGTIPDDFVEIYSLPRLVPECVKRGLRATLSVDLATGYDLSKQSTRMLVKHEIRVRRPRALGLSSPCTMFSKLNRMWNKKKYSNEEWDARMNAAVIHLEFSMELAQEQVDGGRIFFHEHPRTASSWQQECVTHVSACDGCRHACFDQCRFGLMTPVSQVPMKKATKLLHNIGALQNIFHGKHCKCKNIELPSGATGRHQRIQGSEGGYKLSRWAQAYSQDMVTSLVDGICQELTQTAI